MATEALTTKGYITHHLTNLTFGQHPDGTWGFAHSAQEAGAMGFWAFNVDTLGFSLLLGIVFSFIFWRTARNVTTDAPTGLQNFVEWVVEFIDGSVKDIFHSRNTHCTAGAHHFCLDISNEPDGFGACRSNPAYRAVSGYTLS